MNVHSYTIVHYGADYIGYALRSVYDAVDQMHVLYTPHPSHGHQTDVSPIETGQQIRKAIEAQGIADKLKWYQVQNAFYEGPQRDLAVETCRQAGADLILVVDCDEVWDAEVLDEALSYITDYKGLAVRNWLINFTHLWRSFNWCCRDQGWPVRFIDLRPEDRDSAAYIPKELGEIFHFGYAVCDRVMRYKWRIHGHKQELRPDWFESRWSVWPPPGDCHPTNERGFWNPEPFDRERLPGLMREHPFWDLEKIE